MLFKKNTQPFNRQRRFLLLAGASAVVTSACSNLARTYEAPAYGDMMGTKKIRHAFGEIEIPIESNRIAVLGLSVVEAVIALGVQPIAAPGLVIDNFLHLPESSKEITDIGHPAQPSLEKIVALKPDLILTSKIYADPEKYSLLSQIAPTVVCDVEKMTEWKTATRLCAEVLGKEAEADRLETEYEAKLQKIKAGLSDDSVRAEVSVVVLYGGGIFALGQDTFSGTVLAETGVARPPRQATGEQIQISLELLDDIDGDFLFVLQPKSQTEIAANLQKALDRMKANPLWQNLKAVQADRIYEVDAHWYGAGYLAANQILDDVLSAMQSS
ncbi:MAG: iron-siderophore ABC transporter substrate-binding protein [Cyanobacteria bacterium P01_E01_bin.42]